MIICLLYALVALVIALICVVIIEWGLSLIGANPPAQVLMLIRLLVGLLWLIYVIGCLSTVGFGGFRFYPGHPY